MNLRRALKALPLLIIPIAMLNFTPAAPAHAATNPPSQSAGGALQIPKKGCIFWQPGPAFTTGLAGVTATIDNAAKTTVYRVQMGEEYLKPNAQYRVAIVTINAFNANGISDCGVNIVATVPTNSSGVLLADPIFVEPNSSTISTPQPIQIVVAPLSAQDGVAAAQTAIAATNPLVFH